eukprot:scaffold31956_cov17-Prasinocladus_malaysianus.AAC.2
MSADSSRHSQGQEVRGAGAEVGPGARQPAPDPILARPRRRRPGNEPGHQVATLMAYMVGLSHWRTRIAFCE